MSTVSKGKKFEDHVAELYKLMGYEVKQNVGILGHQIDIILTYTMPGGTKTKIAVECKNIEKGNLRKNDVMDNVNALSDLKRNDEVQNLIIVTTNGFAKDFWDTAKRNKIQLLTFRELQHQILQLDQYLNRLIKDFENDEISKYYIDVVAQDDEKTPMEIFDPINDYINKWIADDKINHVSILGEYGTGKTSFCRKFAHDLAIRYNKNPLNNRIPILINLRDYSKVMSVRQLITDLLINEYGLRGIDFPLFEKMNEDGLFLLIFDGFDEMAQKVIFDVVYSNFSKIAELAKPKRSKVLLTCRTEFFRTHEKEKEILLDIDKRENFGIVYLREFNNEQIRGFLKKRVPLIEAQKEKKLGWGYYYKKIQEVFDLKDLAKRPVLLELITKYLPQLIEKGEKINTSTLYQTTIWEELKRRITIGNTIIQRDDRIKLMKLLAAVMYNLNKLSVYYKDIPELLNLKAHFGLRTMLDIEYHLNDFLTCSFLNRDTEGNYRFSHKSFVDFLVAWKFIEDIEKDCVDDFAKKTITHEVVQFIKDYEVKIDKKRLYQWITLTKKKSFSETQYLGGNAVSVLNELREDFAKKGFDFSEAVLDYANFDGLDLEGLDFQNASLKNANLNNTNLADAIFSGADLEEASFEEIGKSYSVVFSPSGRYLASGSDYGIIKIWDLQALKDLTTFRGHTGCVNAVAFSPDGRYLASGSGDETIKIWDLQALKELTTLRGHTGCVNAVAFSPDGRYLASGSGDETIKIWDLSKLKEPISLGDDVVVNSVAFSPNGRYLASGSDYGEIQIWDLSKLKEPISLTGFDYQYLFSWDNVPGNDSEKLLKFLIDELDIVWAEDAKISKFYDGKIIRIFRDKHFATIRLDEEDKGATLKISDERTYYLKEEDDMLNIYYYSVPILLIGCYYCVNAVAFSPNGRYLASGSDEHPIEMWILDGFEEPNTSCGHRNIKIEDLEEFDGLEEPTTLRGHTGCVNAVAFSPSGRYLASGGCDETIKIWDLKESIEGTIHKGERNIKIGDLEEVDGLKEPTTLRGHTDCVNSVAFSPNGRYLASGSNDEAIKIWDVDPKSKIPGKCLRTIKQQITCDGMNIKGVKGLDKEKIKFLVERGAIGVSKDIMEEIKEEEEEEEEEEEDLDF